MRRATILAGHLLALAVRAYQLVLRPLLPAACRFEPSCSAYAIEALRTHGAFRGLWLAAWRIARCNPWGRCGYDPVPPTCGHTHHRHRQEIKAS
jgi:putative membrane protein insertion efficiency factor